MFLKSILLFFVSLSITYVHAADDYDNAMTTARSATDRASAAVSNYGTWASKTWDKLFDGRMDAGFSRLDAAIGGITGDKDQFERATNYRAQIAKERAEHAEKAKKALAEANDSASAAMRLTTNAIATAGTATADAAKYGTLISQINMSSTLTWDINKLFTRYQDVNETVRVIEQQLDKSVMNAYMQQKFARLLSSDNICAAAKSCSDNKGKNKAKFSLSELKDIFPNSGSEIKKANGTKNDGSNIPVNQRR